MGGLFGVVGRDDCTADLFYGTDYHSHLGTKRGGLATLDGGEFVRHIHNIEAAQFRSKFDENISDFRGNMGIGVISDHEDQPLIVGSHLGTFAIVTVGKVANADQLVAHAFQSRAAHFAEMGGGEVNPTELVATHSGGADSVPDGIRQVQDHVEGSCSMLVLTRDGVYVARDRLGRTPVVLGRKKGAYAATLETCALPNLDYEIERYLGPGEIVLMTPQGIAQKAPPGDRMQICAFLWVYYGYPASSYEGINVEVVRNRCGEALARNDDIEVDSVAGIPDSGTGHGIGYAHQAGVPFRRPFVKYTPTWPRSFMPQDQDVRDLVAKMKLIPVPDLIHGQRLLFCEDSIVRGTQLKDTIQRLYNCGAREVHMRPACPPLVYGCKFLNFSRSRSELDLAGRRAIFELEGEDAKHLEEYAKTDSELHHRMVDKIRQRLNLTTLRYQRLEDLVSAIGLPKCKLRTYCRDGAE